MSRERVIAGADRLAGLIAVNARRVDEVEREMVRQVNSVSGDGMRRIHLAKRIVVALEKRLDEVRKLLSSEVPSDIDKACLVLDRPIAVPDDPMTTLITAERLAPIPVADLERTLNSLMSGVRVVRKKAPLR